MGAHQRPETDRQWPGIGDLTNGLHSNEFQDKEGAERSRSKWSAGRSLRPGTVRGGRKGWPGSDRGAALAGAPSLVRRCRSKRWRYREGEGMTMRKITGRWRPITLTPLVIVLLAAGLDLSGCARRAALYGFADDERPARTCDTDTDCMINFGGDGGPEPALEGARR